MTLRALLALSSLALVTACGNGQGDIRLYPLQGPIAQHNPATMIAVKSEDDTDTSGTISFRLPKPDKTRCTGTWTSVVPKVTSRERGLSLTLRDTGGKFKNATEDVGGINNGEIYAICTDGTRVQGTFIMGSGTQSGTGSATDTRGNTYKLLF